MHHFRVMAGAMTLLLLSAPASWAATPQKAKAVPTAEPLKGSYRRNAFRSVDMVWGPGNLFGFPSCEGSRITSVEPETGEKRSSAAFRT